MIVNSKISKNPKQFWETSEIYVLILFFTLLLHILHEKVPYTSAQENVQKNYN